MITVFLHVGGKAVGVRRGHDPVLYTHNMSLARFDLDAWQRVTEAEVPERLRGYLEAAKRRAEKRRPDPDAVVGHRRMPGIGQ
jgi:hypothetical protein